jgi:hypothetical protein
MAVRWLCTWGQIAWGSIPKRKRDHFLPEGMKKVIVAGIAIVILIVTFFAWWHWQANYAEELFTMDIPAWMVDDVWPGARYQISIGKSQVNNYGTLWETTVSGKGARACPATCLPEATTLRLRWAVQPDHRGQVHSCRAMPVGIREGYLLRPDKQ